MEGQDSNEVKDDELDICADEDDKPFEKPLDDLGLVRGFEHLDYPPSPSFIFSGPSSTDISIPVYSPTDSKAIEIKHDELRHLLVDLEDESRSKPVNFEEHDKQDNTYFEAWGNHNNRNGWSASWNWPVEFRTNTHAEELLTRETYKGPEVTGPGILAYGPFPTSRLLLLSADIPS